MHLKNVPKVIVSNANYAREWKVLIPQSVVLLPAQNPMPETSVASPCSTCTCKKCVCFVGDREAETEQKQVSGSGTISAVSPTWYKSSFSGDRWFACTQGGC